MASRHLDAVARGFEHLDGGDPDLRVEVVREGVRPEDDLLLPALDARPASLREPLLERDRRELGHLPLRRHSDHALHERSGEPATAQSVDERGRARGHARRLVDEAEGVGVPGPQTARVVV